MPFFPASSDYSLSDDDVEPGHAHRTPSPPPQRQMFASKADLMGGVAEDHSMPDFEEDSDDSAIEIYGKGAYTQSPQQGASDTSRIFRERLSSVSPSTPNLAVESIDPEPRLTLQGSETAAEATAGDLSSETKHNSQHQIDTLQSTENHEPIGADEDHVKANDDEQAVDIKSEASDNASIHHDDRPEQDSTMIHVDSGTPREPLPPSNQSPTTGYYTSISEAPAEVLHVLEKWWAKHGREVPKWAGHPGYTSTARVKQQPQQTWIHQSGELLEAKVYVFDDIPDPRRSGQAPKRTFVVEGPTLGARIAVYDRSGGVLVSAHTGSRYKLWLGVDGGTSDGFEKTPSVWKGYKGSIPTTSIPALCAKLFSTEGSLQHATAADVQSVPNAPQTQAHGVQPEVTLPKKLENLVQAWFQKYRPSLPPCCGSYTKRTLSTPTGAPAGFWHVSGERLIAEIMPLDLPTNKANQPSQLKTLLMVRPASRSSGLQPALIRLYKQSGLDVWAYKAWHGLKGINEEGFEFAPSYFKINGTRIPSSKSLQNIRQSLIDATNETQTQAQSSTSYRDKSDDSPAKSLRPRDSLDGPSRFESRATAVTRSSAALHVNGHKRKRDEEVRDGDADDEDSSLLLNRFLSPSTVEKSSTTAKSRSPPLENGLSSKKEILSPEAYIKHNTVLLFHAHPRTHTSSSSAAAAAPPPPPPPRIRPLASCDTISKLFGQAVAGNVFETITATTTDTTTRTKVVAVTFGGAHRQQQQQQTFSLVEDDEQDFEDFWEAVRGMDCWSEEDVSSGSGGVSGLSSLQGSLAVDVRAKY